MLCVWTLLFIFVLNRQDLVAEMQEFWFDRKGPCERRCAFVHAVPVNQTRRPALPCMKKLCLEQIAADLVPDPQGSSEQNVWCDDHNVIHRRLDNIQEQVEKTVDYLDSEVKSLLNDISETAWNVPLPPGTPLMDIFEEPN